MVTVLVAFCEQAFDLVETVDQAEADFIDAKLFLVLQNQVK